MSSIPGVSIEKKLSIQHKIDKIIKQEFLAPCPHFLDKTSLFNHRLYNAISSEISCKRKAKISTAFHFGNCSNSFSYITEVKAYLNNPKYLLNLLFSTFPTDELIILLNHIDVFIKNEYVRKYFPKIKKESVEDIFDKNIVNEDKQTNTLPIVFPYDMKNEIKVDAKKKVQDKVRLLFTKERKKINQYNQREAQKEKKLKRILSDLGEKINNIRKYSDNKVNKHPIVEYYMKKKLKKSSSMKEVFKPPKQEKYRKMFDENKKIIKYMKELEDNLIQNNQRYSNNNK